MYPAATAARYTASPRLRRAPTSRSHVMGARYSGRRPAKGIRPQRGPQWDHGHRQAGNPREIRLPIGDPARTPLLGALAYGLSTLVLFYGRLAFLEPVTAMFLTGGVLCVTQSQGPRPRWWGAAAGTCFALAVGTKLTALVAVPAVLVVVAF